MRGAPAWGGAPTSFARWGGAARAAPWDKRLEHRAVFKPFDALAGVPTGPSRRGRLLLGNQPRRIAVGRTAPLFTAPALSAEKARPASARSMLRVLPRKTKIAP